MSWKYAANLQENTHVEVRFQSNFIEMALRHWCSPVNLLHIFRTPFPKNTSGWLPLYVTSKLFRCSEDLLSFLSSLVLMALYQTQTEYNRLTHTYRHLLKPPMHTTAALYCNEWITWWNKYLIYRGQQRFSFSKITHMPKSYICWWNLSRVSPSWQTQNTDTNGIFEQSKHTHTPRREKYNFRERYLVLVSDTPFFRTTPLFYYPFPFLWENCVRKT